ncbi:succinylglutamate desuccinylase/aspartoacylase family protein [Massilia sp. W12]|uniref:succinylglutamate desuccinylase/aspartoacylase domain-containing protein n=1 Tax=Massilia sp. W12 TaxID=3126507 RepID=UPI0030D39792
MRIERHSLPADSLQAEHHVLSLHFGPAGAARKVYIQAGLHADELPGLLTADHLRRRLQEAEQQAQICGEIVLVALANPLGLAQSLHGQPFGRFQFDNGINFNRQFPLLAQEVAASLEGQELPADEAALLRLLRRQARELLLQGTRQNAASQLKHILLALAIDADLVLDLHCDCQAVMHAYTSPQSAQAFAALFAYSGARAVLTAQVSGGEPFDESCSRLWPELAQLLGRPLPQACHALTLELRGQTDVSDELAAQDAAAICAFLQSEGILLGAAPPLPPAHYAVTPLAGVEPLHAATPGVIVFDAEVGQMVQPGQLVAEIVDPVHGVRSPVRASIAGLLYARTAQRYALRGMEIARIAGQEARRAGDLLSA